MGRADERWAVQVLLLGHACFRRPPPNTPLKFQICPLTSVVLVLLGNWSAAGRRRGTRPYSGSALYRRRPDGRSLGGVWYEYNFYMAIGPFFVLSFRQVVV